MKPGDMDMSFLPRLVGLTLSAFVLASPVLAQNANVLEAANMKGAERTAKLYENAKKEGVINLYTSQTLQDMTLLKILKPNTRA
jgi:hypothetical protein